MHFPQRLKIRDRLLADVAWPIAVLECERRSVEPELLLAAYWHLANDPTTPAFGRYWTKADKG